MNTVILGDCLEKMDDIPDESIDIVITDPPYGAGYDFENDDLEDDDFAEFTEKWVKKASSKLKQTGSMYVFIYAKRLGMFQNIIDKYLIFRNIVVWHFEGFFNRFRKNYDNRCEFILFYSKSDSYTFNVIKEPPSDSLIKRWKPYADKDGNIPFESLTPAMRIREKKENYDKNPININRGTYLGNVVFCKRVRNRVHPTQKPEDLLEKMIKASSDEGQTVLDPFSGSGTTCAVAKRMKRRFIGIEISEEYHSISIKRLESIKVPNTLDRFITKVGKIDYSLLKYVKR